MANDPLLQKGGKYEGRKTEYALDRFAFYECYKCKVRACHLAARAVSRALTFLCLLVAESVLRWPTRV
jgi:hypothetical protein